MEKLKAFLKKEIKIDSKYIKLILLYIVGFAWLYSVPSVVEFSIFYSDWREEIKLLLSVLWGAWAFFYPCFCIAFELDSKQH